MGKKKLAAEEHAPVFLEHVKVTSFGKFANLIVGPFKPGMNVVYGPNEAGKTTINQLVKGVLFGWPQARGAANPYRPENAERMGSLFFTNELTGVTAEVKRVKSTDVPEDVFQVLGDIDKGTYETTFSLTSDELMGLDRHDDVTTRLLTAGSGTNASPAQALRAIDDQIKELMSRSSQFPDSVTNLKAAEERMRGIMREQAAEAERFRDQEKRLAALEPRREALAQTQERLNEEIERLGQAQTTLEMIDAARASNEEALTHAVGSEQATHDDPLAKADEEMVRLRALSTSEEYHLRDSLDDLEEGQRKAEHLLANAKRDAAKSQAAFDALMQDRDLEEERRRARRQRIVQLVLSIAIPALMLMLAAYLLLFAAPKPSLTMVVVAVFCVVSALAAGAGGLFMNLRPSKVEERLAERRKKAEWVVQQDQRIIEACESELRDHMAKIETFLGASNLSAAHGSIRRARRLLDDARDARMQQDARIQNQKALALQVRALRSEAEALWHQREEVCQGLGLAPDAPVAEVTELIARRQEERLQTNTLANQTNRQCGELSQELQQARTLFAFDEQKFELSRIEERLKEANHHLAKLLIARMTLEDAVASWEKKSQPEVYQRASELFELMTDGVWKQVRMNANGEIEVVDAVRTTRSPNLLSVGTRQQLYLSLRIALLMTARSVGASLPIMCDDILVNFDAKRQRQAARALVELAKVRQVVLFTCHPQVAKLFKQLDPTVNSIEL